jgi:enamine deaminase RidA (YjgF/YER057c/UK114 family)
MSLHLEPAGVPRPEGGYAQGIALAASERLVFVSGQIPVDAQGRTPPDFAGQCRLVWHHVLAVLAEAGLEARHLVKVTTFLAERQYAAENGAIRREVLGAHTPALTVIIAGIYDPRWLLEIEAVAAGPAGPPVEEIAR